MLVERFGKYNRTLTPGIRFLIPFVEAPRELHWRYTRQVGNEKQIYDMTTDRVNLREHVLDFGKQSVITMDTVEFEIDALVYFRVVDPRVAVYRVQNLPDAVELLTQASLRNVIAKMSLDDTFSSREKMNKDLLAVVSKDALRWGIVITRVEVVDIVPPREILTYMHQQSTAERLRRATVRRANGAMNSMIIRARGDGKKCIIDAMADKDCSITLAKGDYEKIVKESSAECTVLDTIREECKNCNVSSSQFIMALRWLMNLQTFRGSAESKIYIIPFGIFDYMKKSLKIN
eukprot:g880.t1